MAKIVKKKRKLKLQGLISIVFALSLLTYFGSTIVLHSMNIANNRNLIDLKNENAEKKKELETLRLEVAKYTERDHLMSVCKANGVDLSFDADRITYIYTEE